jgi:phage nucleotide-binding protein
VTDTAEVLTNTSLGGLAVRKVVENELRFNLLIYGDPGVGKTVLAGSAAAVPELSPVLYVDVEGGTLSLRERFPDVDVVRVKNFQEFGKVFEGLRNGEGGYKTVVLDSLTEIQKFGMYAIRRAAIEKDDERDPDLPGIGEWGKNTEQIRRLVRAFRDLPHNVIFICLAQTDQDKRGKRLTKPSLSAKLSNEVAGFLDIVVHMYKKTVDDEVKRVLLTAGTDEFIAKDRTDRLPPIVENPDMQTLYNILFR